MKIQLIRSATLRVTFGGRTFLIDPWLAEKGSGPSYAGHLTSPLVDLPLRIESILEGIDAVIISHLHTDHFDEAARAVLDPNTLIFCHACFAEEIRAFGFSNVHPLADQASFGDVDLRVTPGRHGPDEILKTMGHVSGFLFRAPDEPTLYWAGDTILCDEVRDIIETEQPDIIVVHACGAVWDGIRPLVMDAEMTLETVRLSNPATIVATHLDAVEHATVSRSDLREAAQNERIETQRLLIPEDGEILVFADSGH